MGGCNIWPAVRNDVADVRDTRASGHKHTPYRRSFSVQPGLLLAVAIATAASGEGDGVFFFFSGDAPSVLGQMTGESEGRKIQSP